MPNLIKYHIHTNCTRLVDEASIETRGRALSGISLAHKYMALHAMCDSAMCLEEERIASGQLFLKWWYEGWEHI